MNSIPLHLKNRILISLSFVLSSALPCCRSDDAPALGASRGDAAPVETMQLFAASGTRTPVEALCDDYQRRIGIRIERNYASSGTLARQIAGGAQADIFVSANRQWMDFLVEKKRINKDDVSTVAGNALVFIEKKTARGDALLFTPDFDIRSRAKEKIAIGDPAYVPVGKYTDEMFQTLGWAEKLRGRLILAQDVSAVLRYTALGECDLGVVYRSEALLSDKVRIVAEVPRRLHDPIAFYASPVRGAPHSAIAFLDLLQSDAGRAVFERFGFDGPPTEEQ